MGNGHVRVFLLVIVAAVGSVKGNLCPFAGDWLYHNTTGTCMSINTTKLEYIKARKVCLQNSGGSNRTIPGDLVFIFDKNTDDFVKVLLEKTANVDTALIGLNNRVITSEYRWGETPPKQVLGSYTGWASGSPTYKAKNYVVISAEGWKVMNIGHEAAFVCQVKAVMALPTISCPPAEVGEQTSIVCSVNVPTEEAILTELRFTRSEQEVASCSSGSCRSTTGYTASVRIDPTSWTSTLQISKVLRSDEGSWSCSVKFSNGQEVTSNRSDLKVYSVPSGVECKADYLKETLTVSCTTERMYPEGVCKWDSISGPSSQKLVTHESCRIADGPSGTIFYRTVCNASVIKPAVGKYEFNVSVYPSVPGLDGTNPSTVKRGSLTVNLGAPTNPPAWLDSKGETLNAHLDVVVNQTVTVTCQITDEGQAAVYSLTTKCFSQPLSETSGNVASVNITPTQDFHGQTCSCYGTPVTNSTYVTYVTFRVKSSPRIISFGLQSNPDMRDIEENERVFMTCNATGYPQYQLSLVRDLDWESPLNRTSSEANSSEVTYNMAATCPTGRRFTCQAKNDDGQTDTKQLHLRVRCAPEYCPSTEKVPKHGIALGSSKTLTMCVNAYPAPTSIRLYKDNGTGKVEIKSGYKVNFRYTDEEADVGEITVELYSVQQPALGMYALYTNIAQSGYAPMESYLPFELLAQGDISSSSPGDWKQKVIVVAVVLGLLLVIILVVVVVLVLVRRRRSRVFTAQEGTKDDNVSNGGPNEFNRDNTHALDNLQNKKEEVHIMDTVETPTSPAHFASINEDHNTYETAHCGRRPADTKQNDNTHEKPNEGAVSLNLLKSEAPNTAKATEQGGVYSNMTLSDETEEGKGAAISDDPTTSYDRLTATDSDLNENGIYAKIAADNVLLDSSNTETVDESERTLYHTIN